jgi:hypothetical protein
VLVSASSSTAEGSTLCLPLWAPTWDHLFEDAERLACHELSYAWFHSLSLHASPGILQLHGCRI